MELGSEEISIGSEEVPIEVKKIRCAKCLTCIRSCPYDAISYDDNKIVIDIEKCQLCGICASVCPEYNIELFYYDTDQLIQHVDSQKEKLGTENLVVMCRGSSPQSCEILDVLKEQNVDKFVPLRLPCVGRLKLEFYLKALNSGIKKIITVQCDETFCRMKRGSEVSGKNILRLQNLLKELGYEGDVVTIIKNPQKAIYFTEKCVGCDKCEFICPYDAIALEPLATPQIIFDKCNGCGACALVCPHLAIQLEGFEYDSSSHTMRRYMAESDRKKAQGIWPIILVFSCQWAEFSALDGVKDGFLGENAVLMEIPCINGLDPVQVLNALQAGFDGVIAFVCGEEDCKSKEGRDTSEGNLSALEKVLKSLNLRDRFEIHTTSPRVIGEFSSKLESFIKKMGSLPKLNSGGEA